MGLTLKQKIDLGKQAKQLAEKQRIEWELGMEPIPDIFSLIEGKGILLTAFTAEDCNLSGFAMKLWGKSCIYINSEDVLGRQHFSAAHELCHLIHDLTEDNIKVCYHSEEESEIDEYRAHRFAADFLMPKEKVLELCGSMVGKGKRITNPIQVIELQHIFKVSFSAMLGQLLKHRLIIKSLYDRFKTLSTLDQIENLRQLTTKEGKSLDLILKTGPYIPSWFIDTLNMNYQDGLITWEKLQSVLQLVNKEEECNSQSGGEP